MNELGQANSSNIPILPPESKHEIPADKISAVQQRPSERNNATSSDQPINIDASKNLRNERTSGSASGNMAWIDAFLCVDKTKTETATAVGLTVGSVPENMAWVNAFLSLDKARIGTAPTVEGKPTDTDLGGPLPKQDSTTGGPTLDIAHSSLVPPRMLVQPMPCTDRLQTSVLHSQEHSPREVPEAVIQKSLAPLNVTTFSVGSRLESSPRPDVLTQAPAGSNAGAIVGDTSSNSWVFAVENGGMTGVDGISRPGVVPPDVSWSDKVLSDGDRATASMAWSIPTGAETHATIPTDEGQRGTGGVRDATPALSDTNSTSHADGLGGKLTEADQGTGGAPNTGAPNEGTAEAGGAARERPLGLDEKIRGTFTTIVTARITRALEARGVPVDKVVTRGLVDHELGFFATAFTHVDFDKLHEFADAAWRDLHSSHQFCGAVSGNGLGNERGQQACEERQGGAGGAPDAPQICPVDPPSHEVLDLVAREVGMLAATELGGRLVAEAMPTIREGLQAVFARNQGITAEVRTAIGRIITEIRGGEALTATAGAEGGQVLPRGAPLAGLDGRAEELLGPQHGYALGNEARPLETHAADYIAAEHEGQRGRPNRAATIHQLVERQRQETMAGQEHVNISPDSSSPRGIGSVEAEPRVLSLGLRRPLEVHGKTDYDDEGLRQAAVDALGVRPDQVVIYSDSTTFSAPSEGMTADQYNTQQAIKEIMPGLGNLDESWTAKFDEKNPAKIIRGSAGQVVRDLPSYRGVVSGMLLQEAAEGAVGGKPITDVLISLNGPNVLPQVIYQPTPFGQRWVQSHTSSELAGHISEISRRTLPPDDIGPRANSHLPHLRWHIANNNQVTTFVPERQFRSGPPLPEAIERLLPPWARFSTD